jgi:Flp pilus assembly protein TadG
MTLNRGFPGRRRSLDDDRGAAMVEFVVIFVVLLVPLVYLVLAVFDVQRNAYAATAATREAGRVFVLADSSQSGERQARAAAALALADHGIDASSGTLTITCSATPCLTPGATVTVSYDTVVPLPFVPDLGADRPLAAVAVHSRRTLIVDPLMPARP